MLGRGDIWPSEQKATLIYQIEVLKRKPIKIKVRGRTSRAIDHKISQLRKEGELETYFLKPWSDEEDDKLITGANEGKTLDQIIIEGRDDNAKYSRIKLLRKMGYEINLVKRLRPQQVAAHIRKAKVEKRKRERKLKLERLKELLNGVGRHWPSSIVAEKLSCHPDWVGRWRKRWNLELIHNEAMTDPVYKEHFLKQVANRLKSKLHKKIKGSEEINSRTFERKFRMERLLIEFHQISLKKSKLPLIMCSSCQSVWFGNETFFPPLPSQNGKKTVLSNICKACSE